jgi:ferritin
MLKPGMQEALNRQVNAELFSAYLYLSMSAHFEAKGLQGMAHWMRMQFEEEQIHAMKIYDFINERSGTVILTAIEAPKTEWGSVLEVFESTYEHEQKVTSLINDLVSLAYEEKDHATASFLQWFVDEQVEEEANASQIIDQLKMVGEDGGALFLLDAQLAQRVAPTVPPDSGGGGA